MVKFLDRVKLARSRSCYMCEEYKEGNETCGVLEMFTRDCHANKINNCHEMWGAQPQFKLSMEMLLSGKRGDKTDKHRAKRIDKENERWWRKSVKANNRISHINPTDLEG